MPISFFFKGIERTDDKAQTPKRTKAGQLLLRGLRAKPDRGPQTGRVG